MTKRDLPKHVFVRGARLWHTFKDANGQWKNKPTPYSITQVDQCAKYVKAYEGGIKQRAAELDKGNAPATTFREYAERWLLDREKRGISAAIDERSRLEKYAYPHIGNVPLDETRPHHVRDLVRALRALTKDRIAPRTIHHVFNTVYNVFETALIDELVLTNPVRVKPGEMPKKVDADPEWRINATYTTTEVERLISDPIIPVERRVMHALKAIAGLRHGEAAAVCFRHWDANHEPLGRLHIVQAYSSRNKERFVKDTKSEEARTVPVHDVLAKLLHAWKTEHWVRIYGRQPTPDDYIVPTRNLTCVNAKDAGDGFQDDLKALELRQAAGKRRKRGGHDLRSWFITRLAEDGADSQLTRRFTHASAKDVEGGYQRFSWSALCRELGKLSVKLVGDPLRVLTASLQREQNASGRWFPGVSEVTPSGLEAGKTPGRKSASGSSLVDKGRLLTVTSMESRARTIRNPLTALQTASQMLLRAVKVGDLSKISRIAIEMQDIKVAATRSMRATRKAPHAKTNEPKATR